MRCIKEFERGFFKPLSPLFRYPNPFCGLSCFIHSVSYITSQFYKCLSSDTIFIQGYRATILASFHNTLHDWNLSQQTQSLLVSKFFGPLFTEDIVFIIRNSAGVNQDIFSTNPNTGTCIPGDSNILIPFTASAQSHLLRCTNHDCTTQSDSLYQSQVNITCSRRKVDQHKVQFVPETAFYHLF